MLELITIPLAMISVVIMVGMMVEGFEKGFSNLSAKEQVLFFVSISLIGLIIFTDII